MHEERKFKQWNNYFYQMSTVGYMWYQLRILSCCFIQVCTFIVCLQWVHRLLYSVRVLTNHKYYSCSTRAMMVTTFHWQNGRVLLKSSTLSIVIVRVIYNRYYIYYYRESHFVSPINNAWVTLVIHWKVEVLWQYACCQLK